MKAEAEFDAIIYGATGFVGRLVAEHVMERFDLTRDQSWALAGRSAERLDALRRELGVPALPVIVADADDAGAMLNLARRTLAVINVSGPYARHGSKLVAACVESGTDYLDLSGEPIWNRLMIDRHAAAAQASGARILFACGYDSLPSELGVLLVQKVAQTDLGHPVERVKMRARSIIGTLSGGTAETVRHALDAAKTDPAAMAILSNPYALAPGFSGPQQPEAAEVEFDSDIEEWVVPFIMNGTNAQNVHRSNFLQNHAYGAGLRYDEMLVIQGANGIGAAKAAAAKHVWANWDHTLGAGGPAVGEGPGREEREAGSSDYLFVGLVGDGRQIRVAIGSDIDPGYGTTAKMIVETALCLARDGAAVPGGIWTAGAALGPNLVDQLEAHAGMSFEIEQRPGTA